MKQRWVFYHSTDLPKTEGRTANVYYEPIARALEQLGHSAKIVAPRTSAEGQDAALYLPFSHEDAFRRWAELEMPEVVCVWTCKPSDMSLAQHLRGYGITVIFAELGWVPQSHSIYFDERGTGTFSSLVTFTPPAAEATVKLPLVHIRQWMGEPEHTGVLLQMESDWNMITGPWRSNGDFLAMLLELWPREKFLVRPHPNQQDVALPVCDRIELARDGSLHDWFDRCKVVAGMNSTALVEALFTNLPVYQLAPGIGHKSGAFITNPEIPPDEARARGEWRQLQRRNLLVELCHYRQIDIRHADQEALVRNRVLGKILARS